MLDLMKDIEVLAEIDYPKLLSYNVQLQLFRCFKMLQ